LAILVLGAAVSPIRPIAVPAPKDAATVSTQIANVLIWIINALSLALLGRAILSWFDPGLRWTISRLLFDITEPFVAPIRRVVPSVGMIDLSFIVALVLLRVLERLLAQALYG
jgi:YggT family protein